MNQLVTIDTQSNVEAYRASTNAADLCKEIVLATSSNIQGRKFVSVEGWQAIAVAHGCVLSARDVEKVDGGVRAIGEVRRMSDGQLIATGEGFVGEDEPTWYGGPSRGKTLPKRNDYAIRAMAQTRAMSRAGRTAFAHVVVMMKAGLATTPAEEVPHDGFDNLPHTNPAAGITPANQTAVMEMAPQKTKVEGVTKIKTAVREMKARGNEATDLDEFNVIVAEYADPCAALAEAQHEWWTGRDRDGNEFESVPAWIARRREELTPDEAFKTMLDSLVACDTRKQLQNFLAANGDAIEALDGINSRKFELAYQFRESLINEMDRANA